MFGFNKAGPNQAMIVSGPRKTPRVVVGGLTFVVPIIERLDRLSLEVMTLIVETPRVYTKQGVAVSVDGVAQVKVASGVEAILTSAQQFLPRRLHPIVQPNLWRHCPCLPPIVRERLYQLQSRSRPWLP